MTHDTLPANLGPELLTVAKVCKCGHQWMGYSFIGYREANKPVPAMCQTCIERWERTRADHRKR